MEKSGQTKKNNFGPINEFVGIKLEAQIKSR